MTGEQAARTAPQIPLWVARWTGRLLVAAVALAVVWPPLVEWGGRRWSWPVAVVFGVATVAAAVMLYRLTAVSRRWRRIRAVAALVGGGATVAIVVAAALVEHAIGLRATTDSTFDIAVLAVLGTAMLAIGWPLVALDKDAGLDPVPAPDPVPALEAGAAGTDAEAGAGTDAEAGAVDPRWGIAVAAGADSARPWLRSIAVLAAIAVVGTVLAAAASGADRSTVRPLAGLAMQPPADLNHTTWSATVPGAAWEAGRYLVLDLPGGVEVRDALTGQPRWHYRSHETFSQAVLSADGRTAVVVWPDQEQPFAAGFDVATGAQRWARSLPTESPVNEGSLPMRLIPVGPVVALAGEQYGFEAGGGFAIDASTGATRWRFPEPPADGCRLTDLTEASTAAETIALAYECRGGTETTYPVVGLSGVDGRVRWTWSWRPSPGDDGKASAMQVTVQVRGSQVYMFAVVNATANARAETVVLDAATGVERTRHTSPFLFSPPVIGDDVAAYLEAGSGLRQDTNRVAGVDLRTGQVRWVTRFPSEHGSLILASQVSGNLAYLLVGDDYQTLDLDLVTLDLTTGKTTEYRTGLAALAQARGRCTLLLAPSRLIVVRDATLTGTEPRYATALG
jgi:outer membrane protein assembly factor BamB